jgi:hypothetical protein
MWDAQEPRSIIDAAERAATDGDHATAERLLSQAARLQEAQLGPLHPDLANTLNNLGVVCEITGKLADAEQHFRRALTIATTALDPDHPFVVTSRKNLRDFCEAQGKPFELPTPAPPAPAPDPDPPLASPPAPATPLPIEADVSVEAKDPIEAKDPVDDEDPEVVSKKFFSRVALGALGPIAMLMVVLAAGLPRLNSSGQPVPPLTIAASASQSNSAPAPTSVSAEPIPVPSEIAADTDSEPALEDGSITPAAAVAGPKVVRASLCAELDAWLCDPADRPVPPGPLFFYTQVSSTRDTRIQHRWYRDNRLSQSVELRVDARPRGGYRTYSRYTMNAESAGSWRVELRGEDGALLHEERFTVR